MSAVVGVDIGTTSAKAAGFEADGAVHPAAAASYPLHQPHPGWAEQDADEVAVAVVGVLREAVARTAARSRVAGVCLSSAMHGLVGVDAAGRPVTPLITWADTRAAGEAEQLRGAHPHLHARTGTPLHPMAPLAKLCWLRRHDAAAFAGVSRWCGIKELVVHRLTGRWAMDHSVASGTGLMDLRRLDWDAEALELAGVDAGRLPPLAAVSEVLDWELPLVLGAGDGPLANVGVGAVRAGVAAVSIGTSGALRVMVQAPAVDEGRRLFCYALTPGRWVVGGAISNGGSVLQWAADALAPDVREHREERLLDLAARVPPGSDGLIMLPYLLSERAPHWSAVPRGAYVGLTSVHRRGHLVRAAVEGVCRQLALVLDSVRGAGHEIREIRATGGFARSAFWRSLLADVLGMPVGYPPTHEGSAFGAAVVGMAALGIVDSIDVAADVVAVAEVAEPDPGAAAVYARQQPTFVALYEALGPAFLALDEERRRREGRP